MTLTTIKQFLEHWNPSLLTSNNLSADWVNPSSLDHGILTSNCAFLLAKNLKANPITIAADLKADLVSYIESDKELSGCLEVKIVGPFINLEFTNEAFAKLEFDTLIKESNEGVLLEYVSSNAAKPLHAGHSRNINIGEVIRRTQLLKYPNLKTDNYWGDYGVQFGILLWGYAQFKALKSIQVEINAVLQTVEFVTEADVTSEDLVAIYIWANQQKEKVENFAALVRDQFLKLESGDEEATRLRTLFVDISMVSVNEDLKLLNMPAHDYQLGESYYAKKIPELFEFLEINNIWSIEGKARYFDLEELVDGWAGVPDSILKKKKSLGRCYLISSDGYSSYAFRDIVCRIDWARNMKADKFITVTGNEQIHHFDQFFAIVCYLSSLESFQKHFGLEVTDKLKAESLIHISYGFLSLVEGKMSTRKGNILTLKELMKTINASAGEVLSLKNPDLATEELESRSKIASIAALKWYDLARDSVADLVLDIPKILSFEGNTGVYQLYTVARINSILRKVPGADNGFSSEFKTLNITEKLILKKSLLQSSVIEKVIESYKPHYLTNHLYDLATDFNSWYAKYSISNEPNEVRKAELLVFVKIVKKQLVEGLELLGIETLDVM